MKKILATLSLMLCVFVIATSSYGASAKCKIVEVEGENLILDCGKSSEKFAAGNKIKIKTVKTKQIEGC